MQVATWTWIGVLSWRGSSEPPVCSWLVGSTGNTLGLELALEVEESLWH